MIEKVTISRHWDNPKITTTVTGDGISVQMDMNDFFTAVKKEFNPTEFASEILSGIGPVSTVFRKDTFEKMFRDAFASAWFEKRLETAIKAVLAKMKEETVKVM